MKGASPLCSPSTWVQVFALSFGGPVTALSSSLQKRLGRGSDTLQDPLGEWGIWPRPPWERLQGRCSLTVSGLKAHPCLGFCCNSLLEPSRVQMSHPKVQRGTGFWALRAVGPPDPGPGPGGVSEMLPFLITPSVASLAFPACPKVGSGGGAPPGELVSCSVGLIPSWRLLLQSGYLRNDASRPWEVRSQNQVTQLARDRVWAE